MKIINLLPRIWYKLYVILFCCILNAGVLNASWRSDGNTTAYAVAESYSYDEFIAMLDREGKVPLENIRRDGSGNHTDVRGTETTIPEGWGKSFEIDTR